MAYDTDIERLNYYEGEFLGAADFQAEQNYHREMRRRHNIGQHTWGIVSGLDLLLVPNGSGSAVDIYLQPGMAVDGFGREIVVLNKTQITQDLFAPFTNDPPGPRPMSLWISYAQLLLQPSADPCAVLNQPNAYGRVQEAFALTVTEDSAEPTDDFIVVDGKTLPVPAPPGSSPPPPPPLLGDIVVPYDGSIPYQEFSTDDSAVNWYIAIGQVSWDPGTGLFDNNNPGLAVKGREYAGNVTASVLSPLDTLTIQDRFAPYPLPKDPKDPTYGQFYDGVGVEVSGSLSVDRLLEAKQSVLIDGAPNPNNAKLNLSPLTINASPSDQSLIQFRDSSGPQFSIWETPATTSPKSPAGLNIGETDNSGKPTTSDIFIQQGGNVGIGTTGPLQNLSVNGGLNIDQGSKNDGTTLNPGLSFGSGPVGSSSSGTGIASNQSGAATNPAGLDFYTAGQPRLSITNNGLLHVMIHTVPLPMPSSQGVYLAWNALTGGTGETDFINSKGSGPGGFAFFNVPSSAGLLTTVPPLVVITGSGGLGIDQANQNSGGTVAPGLTFGSGSGEGIASCRTLGTNRFGLDFYTNFKPRLSITNGGDVSMSGNLTVNGARTYLVGQDGARNHWIMGGGTVETVNNAIALSFDSASNTGSITVASNWAFVSGSVKFAGKSLVQIHRLFNSATGDHFYTPSAAEAANAVANDGYVDETPTAPNFFAFV